MRLQYTKCFTETLFNPTEAERLEREPLIKFSFYLNGRVNVLCAFAEEILSLLDEGFLSSPIHGDKIERAESLMWLWILGAYEVIRTICQAKLCFSKFSIIRFEASKRKLAKARMPAAKMEKQGRKEPVVSSRSPAGWNSIGMDLWINDPDDEDLISAREVIKEFDQLICSIKSSDILMEHESSYSCTK